MLTKLGVPDVSSAFKRREKRLNQANQLSRLFIESAAWAFSLFDKGAGFYF